MGAIGNLEDAEINDIDLDKLYTEIECNGTHGCSGYTTEELSEILTSAIETGDF